MVSVAPLEGDTDPSPLLGNLPGSIRHRSRIATPAVRRGTSTLRGAGSYGRPAQSQGTGSSNSLANIPFHGTRNAPAHPAKDALRRFRNRGGRITARNCIPAGKVSSRGLLEYSFEEVWDEN